MASIMILSLVGIDTPAHSIQKDIEIVRREIASYRNLRNREDNQRIRVAALDSIIEDVLGDAATRTSFRERSADTIESVDGDFTLTVGYYNQFDWVVNKNRVDGTKRGFQTSTSRLTASGDLYGSAWSYAGRLLLGNGSDGDAQFAYVQGNIDESTYVQFGLLSPMFSLEQAIDNNDQLGVYLSFIAGTFDPESLTGICLFGGFDQTRGWITLTNGWDQELDSIEGNQRQGVFARVEWSPFGSWDDLYRFNPYPEDTDEGMMIGVGGNFDWGDYDPVGVRDAKGDATRMTADFSWQTAGFATLSTINWQDVPEDISFGGRRWAATTQVAWFPTGRIEIYARGEWGTILGPDSTDLWMATFGASWYPVGDNKIKITVEIVRGWGSTLDWKIDGNPGIVEVDAPQTAVRTQIQLSF